MHQLMCQYRLGLKKVTFYYAQYLNFLNQLIIVLYWVSLYITQIVKIICQSFLAVYLVIAIVYYKSIEIFTSKEGPAGINLCTLKIILQVLP